MCHFHSHWLLFFTSSHWDPVELICVEFLTSQTGKATILSSFFPTMLMILIQLLSTIAVHPDLTNNSLHPCTRLTCWLLQMSENMYFYLSSCICLVSSNHLYCIYVNGNDRISSLWITILLCTYDIFSLSFDGYLGWLHIIAIVDRIVIKTGCYYFCDLMISSSFDVCPLIESFNHIVIFFRFLKTLHMAFHNGYTHSQQCICWLLHIYPYYHCEFFLNFFSVFYYFHKIH